MSIDSSSGIASSPSIQNLNATEIKPKKSCLKSTQSIAKTKKTVHFGKFVGIKNVESRICKEKSQLLDCFQSIEKGIKFGTEVNPNTIKTISRISCNKSLIDNDDEVRELFDIVNERLPKAINFYSNLESLVSRRKQYLTKMIQLMKLGIGIDSQAIQSTVNFSQAEFDSIYTGNQEIEVLFEELNEKWKKATELASRTFPERIQIRRAYFLSLFDQDKKSGFSFSAKCLKSKLASLYSLGTKDVEDLQDPNNLKLWNEYKSALKPFQFWLNARLQWEKLKSIVRANFKTIAGSIGAGITAAAVLEVAMRLKIITIDTGPLFATAGNLFHFFEENQAALTNTTLAGL